MDPYGGALNHMVCGYVFYREGQQQQATGHDEIIADDAQGDQHELADSHKADVDAQCGEEG
ncbi:MAG: hypothetical protein QGH66_04595 [Dehalococcoidia bacterium]|nr:hypothetical protein [Dehalococcoidia bacterium]